MFESVLALVLLNAGVWFLAPFSPLQLISWAFLASSLFLALHGLSMLRTFGAPEGDIETTTRLVTSGAYRYIRHPLYCSLLLLGVGAFLKGPSPLALALVLLLATFAYATARIEERDNLDRFGEAYRAYMKKTRMFIPFVV